MKVAIIGTTASSVCGFRRDLISQLVSNGVEVFALAVDFDDSSRDFIQALGATPVDFTLRRSSLNPFSDLADMWKLSRVLKKIGPDVVLSYFSKPVIYGTLAAKISRVPRRVGMLEGLGYTFTDHPFPSPFKTKIIRWIQVLLYRISFRYIDEVIFLNHDDVQDLVIKNKIKVSAVTVLGPIGLDLADYPFSPPVTDPIRFIFVGRLLVEKGIREFVEAARIVKVSHPNSEFVVLGGLDEVNPGGLSKNAFNELIDEGLVIYPGHVADVARWISDSSVFVLPSYREGFPRSTQEAMAIGRAVITSDAPGCRDSIIDGLNGFLVPRWSSDKLADKMLFFIDNPDAVTEMGKESYCIAREKFDCHKVNLKLMNLVLGSSGITHD